MKSILHFTRNTPSISPSNGTLIEELTIGRTLPGTGEAAATAPTLMKTKRRLKIIRRVRIGAFIVLSNKLTAETD
jgi:hypothetical protein